MAEPDTLEDLYATSAAYAGLGMGLGEQHTDPYTYEREEYCFPTQSSTPRFHSREPERVDQELEERKRWFGGGGIY